MLGSAAAGWGLGGSPVQEMGGAGWPLFQQGVRAATGVTQPQPGGFEPGWGTDNQKNNLNLS